MRAAAGRVDVTFAGSTLRVEYGGGRSARIVRFLWRDVRRGVPCQPVFTCRLEDDDASGFRMQAGDQRVYEGPSEEAAVDCLLDSCMYHLADRSRAGLVLHAAVVADADGAVLLPGPSGTGKTTLAAWLAAHGWRYLTDELAFVREGSGMVSGLARPLNVKAGSMAVLRAFADPADTRGDTLATSQGILLRPSALGCGPPAGRRAIARIVFPQFATDGSGALTPLSPGRAGARLMGCLINARNLAGHGLPETARLARQLPAFELRYGSFSQLGDWLR